MDSAGPFGTPPMTTAEGLGALRSELLAAGFDDDQAQEVVMAYVKSTAGEGYCVKAVQA